MPQPPTFARAASPGGDGRRLREERRREAERAGWGLWLFTGLNTAVFLILAASVVGAAVVYSQGF